MTDDQPFRVHEAVLTTADALAWEQLPGELRGWRKFAFFAWLASAGAILALVTDGWPDADRDWRFWLLGLALLALNYAVWVLATNLAQRWRARRRIAAPTPLRVEEWGDHLAASEGDRHTFMAYETVAATVLTPRHLFVVSPPAVMILPLRAFQDPSEMAALAERITAAGRDDEQGD